MTADIVPENFTIGLVITDLIPVVFFGLGMILVGARLKSVLFTAGALVCLAAGAVKVLWKLIVVLKKKNVWPMFVQMRILMPAGFLLMIAGILISCLSGQGRDFPAALLASAVFRLPSGIFFAAWLIGMILMTVFAVRFDSSDLLVNEIEQITNGCAQAALFFGILFL